MADNGLSWPMVIMLCVFVYACTADECRIEPESCGIEVTQ